MNSYKIGIGEDSGIYNGSMVKDKSRQGYGKMEYDNGIIYEGLWQHDIPNGRGSF